MTANVDLSPLYLQSANVARTVAMTETNPSRRLCKTTGQLLGNTCQIS